MSIHSGHHSRLWLNADELLDGLPPFEQQHCRNRTDPQAAGNLGILVGIELSNADAALVIVGKLFDCRSDESTGTAPGSPEVNQNWLRTLENFSLEVIVGKFQHVACHRHTFHDERFTRRRSLPRESQFTSVKKNPTNR